MPSQGWMHDRNSLGSRLATVRQYWWAVAALVVLALLGGLLSTAVASTTYTGRTSLIVSSNDRSPEQDAVLVQGYVAYFDNDAYQKQLLAEAQVDPQAELTAQAAAASPILVITATASDATSAQAAAIAVARAFKDDINAVHARTTAAALATVQDQLDTALARNGKDDQAVIGSLQEQIRTLQADQDNVLQELQSRGGVSVKPPALVNNLVLGLSGGLLLGVLAALALGRLSPRLRSRHDIADKIGLDTLVELPGADAEAVASRREERLRQLANMARARLAGGSGVVNVTQAGDGASTWLVARGLALEWATQGYPTVLVRFGGGLESPPSRGSESGQDVVRPTEAAATLSRMRPGPLPNMSILDMRLRLVGGAATLPAAKVTDLLKLEPLVDAVVVIETSAVASSAAAQAASLASDVTLLVVDTQVAKVAETREAVAMLRQSGVIPLGAVLVSMGGGDNGLDIGDHDGGLVGRPGVDRGAGAGNAGWSW